MGRILALDWGKVRVGVALSDPLRFLASPYETIPAKPENRLLERIRAIIAEEEVELVLVGLPLNMDGTEGSSAAGARGLADKVAAAGVSVEMVDERLSSFAAEQRLRASGRKPSLEKDRVDRAAAALMLQEYLDERR